MATRNYNDIIMRTNALLSLKIETKEPIELGAFVGSFTSIAAEYKRHIRNNFPDLEADAEIYVKEVRQGSTIIDFLPIIGVTAPLIVSNMEAIMVAEQFVKVWGNRITSAIKGSFGESNVGKNDLKTISDATEAIARDPNAKSTLEAVFYENGERDVRAAFVFNTTEAQKAQQTVEATYKELEKSENQPFERVLLVFKRTDVADVAVGKRSGERVIIEEISTKPLAVMYASELAESRIKHEIREAEENVYKKGFVVDVSVKTVGTKPSAYSITNVHQVIDLPD